MKTKTHTFDWHAENRASGGMTGTFLAWMVTTLIPIQREQTGEDLFEQIRDASEGFTKVELGITINGVPVDARAFADRLDKSIDWAVDREAKKMLLERVPRIQEIEDAVAGFERSIKEHMVRLAEEAGFEISEDEWRDWI